MQIILKDTNSYLEGYKELISSNDLGPAKYTENTKQQAIDNFVKLGFPTLKDEDWRFTNILPIVKSEFVLQRKKPAGTADIDINKHLVPELDSHLMVFVDGVFSKELSDVGQVNEAIIIKPIADALNENRELVEKHLFSCADIEAEAFTALNTAYFSDGAFVYVPKNTVLDKTVQILYVSANPAAYMYSPRNLIVVEQSSRAKIVEHYVSLVASVYLSNTVSEVIIGENSTVDHYFIEQDSKKAYNISSLEVKQSANSNLNSHSFLLGGSIVRNNIHPVLSGQGCDSHINGLFLPAGRQHIDNFMKVEHASPHCDSRQVYNGILADKSKGVFHGRIIVHEDAQKTDAKQTNRNLLLSDTAKIDTKPQLEIYADDVKCTHGATIGQIDKDSLFYLRSRGIEQSVAKAIMLRAFASQNIEDIGDKTIKSYVEILVNNWFSEMGMEVDLD
ncbi:MAG: Fe-S cluster assembly protein SufD [Candidatus Dadabacteria bacterium]|nr:Fe-S cluster assembly protein SufD [Candidatus Dadabacteria bacterium]NIS10315.1 Fe-S cluster assembly protein SufD [Candidatus Dadabacteria bacterium]NIV42973.1 Fe-S cluster assembly protein SufD [Candidatus Dadabacteria bacterium]NIY23235.1 Fe-S cluster assembly protein SufD [Candidatus Dadabacteria bacterium]